MTQKNNAVKHGLFAKEALLPHENRAQYLRFRRNVINDLLPGNQIEIHMANEIADAAWRLRRSDDLVASLQNNIYQKLTPQMVCEFAAVPQALWHAAPHWVTDMQHKVSKKLAKSALKVCDEYLACEKNFRTIPHLQMVWTQFRQLFIAVDEMVKANGEVAVINVVTKKIDAQWHANNALLWKRLETAYQKCYFLAHWKNIDTAAHPYVQSWYFLQEVQDHRIGRYKQIALQLRSDFRKQLKAYADLKKSLQNFSNIFEKLAGDELSVPCAAVVHSSSPAQKAHPTTHPVS